MRQPGIVVAQDVLEPGPVGRGGASIEPDQQGRQRIAGLAGGPIAAEPAEVFVDAQQRERPGAGRGHPRDGRQGQLEVGRGPGRQVGPPRPAHAGPQRPEGPPLAVLRADLLQPAAIEAQEVPEPAPVAVEGRLEEGRRGRGDAPDLGAILAQLAQEHGGQQGPGVVVGAIALGWRKSTTSSFDHGARRTAARQGAAPYIDLGNALIPPSPQLEHADHLRQPAA